MTDIHPIGMAALDVSSFDGPIAAMALRQVAAIPRFEGCTRDVNGAIANSVSTFDDFVVASQIVIGAGMSSHAHEPPRPRRQSATPRRQARRITEDCRKRFHLYWNQAGIPKIVMARTRRTVTTFSRHGAIALVHRVAKCESGPLLFKDNDFSQTDIEPALKD